MYFLYVFFYSFIIFVLPEMYCISMEIEKERRSQKVPMLLYLTGNTVLWTKQGLVRFDHKVRYVLSGPCLC